jgi:hypothetical protein
MRTAKRGVYTIGPSIPAPFKDTVSAITTQSAIIYSIGERMVRSLVIEGIHSRKPISGLVPTPPRGACGLPNACLTSALLKEVKCIWIFLSKDTDIEFCRGLIIEYLDGSQTALGSCRLGVDSFERCADLSLFSFTSVTIEAAYGEGAPRRLVKVKVAPRSEDGPLDVDWTYCSEGDTLKVWVTWSDLVLQVVK